MVQIPVFTNQVPVPVARLSTVDPGAFAAVGEAVARGGGAISEVGQEFNQRYMEARRQADATNIVSGVSAKLADMQFRYSKTPDRAAALAGFAGEAQQLRESTLKDISDPLIQSYVSRSFDQESISRENETGNAAFGLESSKRRGDLDTNLNQFATSAAGAASEPLRAQMVDNGVAAIRGAVAAGWLNPEAGAKRELQFHSDIEEVHVRQALNTAIEGQNPDVADKLAQALNDPASFPGLTPEKREILSQHADNVAYRLSAREVARQAHEDAQADKLLRQRQAQNETGYLADIYSNKPVDMAQVYRKAYAGELSAAGVNAIEAAIDRRTAGKDDPQTMAHLWGAIGDGKAGAEDVYAAGAAGRIRGETMAEMMRTINERGKQDNNAVERGAFNTLKTALSGGAIEQGLFRFDNTEQARAIQAWAQAQGEWNRRVMLNKEDPMAVLSDLAPKYSSTVQRPTWLAAPRFGQVTDGKTLDAVAVRTLQARDRGEIDAGTYQGEVQLLNNYRNFYLEKASRDAASIVIPFAKPGGKPRIEKAAP